MIKLSERGLEIKIDIYDKDNTDVINTSSKIREILEGNGFIRVGHHRLTYSKHKGKHHSIAHYTD